MSAMPPPPKNMNFNTNTNNNDEWLTDPKIVKSLGEFDLDPCQPVNPPFYHGKFGFDTRHDGLVQDWTKYNRIWCNPPYGRETFKWIKKLYEHGNGIALIFARTETIGFHSEILNKEDAVFFFKGRLNFFYVNGERGGAANAPSCLIAYGKDNIRAIRNSNLKGKLVVLNV